tara:strand:- start:357 stop:1223 length:867 start_codon:yes stop_codon:yes gene_type:complete
MRPELPIFLATPRSRSTALQTLASPYMETVLGLYSLGHQTEFFKEYSHRYFSDDVHLDRTNYMEYFPLNRENSPITHHFVYPTIYNNKMQRNAHKLQVLSQEKKLGRYYNIKIMAEDININEKLDIKFDNSMLDFFFDRTFVITRRRDIKGMSLSLLLSLHTNLWHKRDLNKSKYEDLYETPITINTQLLSSIIPSLKAASMTDQFETHIQRSGYKHHTFYYEDMTTLEDMKTALDTVFGNRDWRSFASDEFIENSLPKKLEIDYKRVITNIDEIEEGIEYLIENMFG